MKISRKRKNARLLLAGDPENLIDSHVKDRLAELERLDPEKWALDTMVSLKELPPGQLTADLQAKVDAWVIPMVNCSKCHWRGMLTDCGRYEVPNRGFSVWLCPAGHFLDFKLSDPMADAPQPVDVDPDTLLGYAQACLNFTDAGGIAAAVEKGEQPLEAVIVTDTGRRVTVSGKFAVELRMRMEGITPQDIA